MGPRENMAQERGSMVAHLAAVPLPAWGLVQMATLWEKEVQKGDTGGTHLLGFVWAPHSQALRLQGGDSMGCGGGSL